MTDNKKKLNIFRLLISVMLTTMLIAVVFPLFSTPESVSVHVVAEDPAQTITIYSAQELEDYSRAYAAGGKNSHDTIIISINTGDIVSDNGFVSIGTDSRPFAGELNIPSAGVDVFHLFDCPLFDYVSTDFEITGARTIKIIRERWISTEPTMSRVGTLTSGALFANHVVKGTNAANWNIQLLNFGADEVGGGEGSIRSNSLGYQCLIGDIEAEATVTVSFTNTTEIPVSSPGNAGLICGTMGAGATLNVTTASSADGNVTVTSTGGHAGSLVGQMETGSTLKFNSANNSQVNSVTSSIGYAGGVVGYADDIIVDYASGVTDYAPVGNVTGSLGAGGLFGYYNTTATSTTFDLKDTYKINGVTVESPNATGGVFGELVVGAESASTFTFDGNGDSTGIAAENFSVTLNGSNRGGIAGTFQTARLDDTLTIQNFKPSVTNGNGLIGKIAGSSAAYVLIDGNAEYDSSTNAYPITVTAPTNTTLGAGLIGNIGDKGSFIDVKGYVKISGKANSGLIAEMPAGVLRIQGTTDLSACTSSTATFVGTRGRSLIYALGSGSDSGWLVKRNTSNDVDDVKTWGQVLRTDGSVLLEETDDNDTPENLADDIPGLFTVDMTAHTVTIAAAEPTMSSVTDFAKTALNIQLNAGNIGALQFTSGSANLSSTLLSGTLSLGADISLEYTGLTGLMRDDGKSAADNETNSAFSGTFSGGNKTITLAIGEVYGCNGSGTALTDATQGNQGKIHTHQWNGLFSKIKGANVSGGVVSNLKINGSILIKQTASGMNVGAVAAEVAEDGFCKLDNVDLVVYTDDKGTPSDDTDDVANVPFTIDIIASGDNNSYIGGAIGIVRSGTTVSIDTGSTGIKPTVKDNSAGNGTTNVGGVIGYLNTSTSQSVTFKDGSKIGLDYTARGSRNSVFGAAIAVIDHAAYSIGARQITFDGTVNVDITANGKSVTNKKFGGILGSHWYAADVSINNIVVTNASITATGNSIDFGGLVQTATGHWGINAITLTASKANFNLPGGTFGFITNKAYENDDVTTKVDGKDVTIHCENALYVDVTDAGYDIGALTFTGTPSFSVFDELVADSRFYGITDITANGNAVISITTAGGTEGLITTSGATYNTYLNKTAYGKRDDDVAKKNANTRYYYNLAYARENTATAKYNFLTWTVKEYAHSSLAAWFNPSGTSTFTGTLDMTGLSYYPINLKSAVTFNSATVKLDNVLMENNVKYAYSGEAGTRTTRSDTNQHYLMHTAVFLNAVANITVGGSGLTIQGNVPHLSDSHCGFLVAKTLGGSDTFNDKVNLSNVVFDGAHITTNVGADITDTSYAPLFINNIGNNVAFTLSAASQLNYSGYTTKYAASSLIGDVGSSTGRAINLTFTGLKFDGRSSASSIGNMDTTYGTTKSIFSRATVLNSFLYAGTSFATYNFGIDEDWTNSTTAVHNVTYGKEITSSVEFADKQKKYYNSTYFTHPTAYQSGSAYDFSSGFLPYVYVAYNFSEYKHEIKVNVSVSAAIEGCGKYNDPFIIDNDSKLSIIASIISGDTSVSTSTQMYLPSDLANYDYTETDYTKTLYNFGTTNFTTDGPATTDVRRYLAGAYYSITTDITLDKNYVGLGSVTSATNAEQYAFRGVIVGSDVTVTINSRNPLIYSSVGSVVKGITVNIDVDNTTYSKTIPLAAPTGDGAFAYYNGNATYGAVIGQILGGDNIIDDVEVTFTNVVFSITADSDSNYQRLVPIGGYVGTLVNGGLIFRKMSGSDVGLTNAKCNLIDNSGYLYVNPIIGRVIAGYAFNETTAYHANESEVTLKNGLKNYTITDLVVPTNDTDKLDVTSGYVINVKNSQSLFVLAAIVNSGAGSATAPAVADNAYPALEGFWSAYRAHTTVRGGADYTALGTSSGTDYDKAADDSYTADGEKIPYIIRAYTTAYSFNYYARAIGGTSTAVTINIKADCTVGQGYRGIGSIYYDNASLRLNVLTMTGQKGSSTNSYKITLNMRYLEYNHNYLITATSPYTASPYIAFANDSGSLAGFGLFNKLEMSSASSSNCVQYIELAGNVFYDVYKINGTQAGYKYSIYKTSSNNEDRPDYAATLGSGDETNARTILSVGGLAGIVTGKFYLRNVTFNNLEVEGAKTAGGLIGFVFINTNPNNVSTIDYTDDSITNAGYVNVIGGQCAGGLIGRIYRAGVEIKGSSGGTNIIIKDIKSKNTVPNETNKKYYANMTTGVGGLVGNCWAKDRKINKGGDDDGETVLSGIKSRKLFISGINVKKGVNAANVTVLNDSDGYENYAGGFVGSAHNVWLKITDSNVIGVNVTANAAGGFIGKVSQKYFLYIQNCSANGNASGSIEDDATKDATISGKRHAGGVVGWCIGRDFIYFQLLNFNTVYYNIESTTTSKNILAGAGGAVGYAQGDNVALDTITSNSANYICEFNNLTIKNCNIKTNYTNPDNSNFHYKVGTGGIIGVIDTAYDGNQNTRNKKNKDNASEPYNKYKFSGYNILVKDCTLSHKNGGSTDDNTSTTNRRIGDLVGNNAVQSPMKFVGVSIQNTGVYSDATTNNSCGKHVGYYDSDSNNYGTDPTATNNAIYYGPGYVVYADYNGLTTNQTLPTAVPLYTIAEGVATPSASGDWIEVTSAEYAASSATKETVGGKYYVEYDDSTVNVSAAAPFVTVNPKIEIPSSLGGKMILTGDGVADSVANLAYFDIIGDTFYEVVANYTTAEKDRITSKLSMFRSEASGYLGTDFPILIIDNISLADDIVNGYLQLLTNTTLDYGADSTNQFKVCIYNVTYDNGFILNATGASLNRLDGAFYITNSAFDSGRIQFSLIDVRFFNPAATSKVAYHLYVPVFVKKVLNYQFDIAALSGTDYLESSYSSRYGQMLIENSGTPATLYFKYTYSRSAEEWTNVINAGENVNRHYDKSLLVYKANNNDVLDDFPDDTILVLVDKNRNGKPYYAQWRDAISGTTLNLSAFKETMTCSNGDYSFGGNSFTPKNLDELMTFEVSPTGDNRIFVQCSVGDATVVVSGQGYRLATSVELAAAETTKYSITVDGISSESYYLTIFTEAGDLFHYYRITAPSSFSETAYPSKISDTGAHTMLHLMMGKIFYHSDFEVDSASKLGPSLMNGDNNGLSITLSAEMGVNQDLEELLDEVKRQVAASDVYQSFLVYLNRRSEEGTVRAILGNPAAEGSYNIVGQTAVENTSGGALIACDSSDPAATVVIGSNHYKPKGEAAGPYYSVIDVISDVVQNNTSGRYTRIAYSDTTAFFNAVKFKCGDYYYKLWADDAADRFDIVYSDYSSDGTVRADSQNFIEFVSGNLASVFGNSDGYFTVQAEINLSYSSSAIPTQFPGRNDEFPDNGVTVSGASNIAFSTTGTTYSKNSISGDETPAKSYYSEAPVEAAKLDLNPIGSKTGDFTPLGINPLNLPEDRVSDTEVNIDLFPVINATAVMQQIEGYNDAVVTITLRQKGIAETYGDELIISDYITRLSIYTLSSSVETPIDISSSFTDGGTSYSFTVPHANLNKVESTIELPYIRLTVLTGSAFEAEGFIYGNYRVDVNVVLKNNSGNDINPSKCSNHVIYTNAKVRPDFIQ